MKRKKQLEIFEDTFIREVRVSYYPTKQRPFKITGPEDVATFFRSVMPDNSREHLIALYLSSSHEVASYSIIATGTANSAQMHARELFQRAIVSGAVAIILSHNHPGGQTKPSDHDRRLTKEMHEAGELLKIPLLDHVIVTDSSFFSFADNCELTS